MRRRNKFLCRRCKAKKFVWQGRVPMIRCTVDFDNDYRFMFPEHFYRSKVPCGCLFVVEHVLFPIDLRKACYRTLSICKKLCSKYLVERNSDNSIWYQCSLCDRKKFHSEEQFNARKCAAKCLRQLQHYISYNLKANSNEQKTEQSV